MVNCYIEKGRDALPPLEDLLSSTGKAHTVPDILGSL